MTPVAIGDTQGTLQARKTCITPYKRPETLLWVYMEVLQSLVPMTMGLNNKPCLFSLFSLFSTMGYFWQNFGKMGVGSTPRCPGDPASRFQPLPAICWLAEKCHPWSQYPRKSWGLEKCQKRLQTYQGHVVTLENASKKFQPCIINS